MSLAFYVIKLTIKIVISLVKQQHLLTHYRTNVFALTIVQFIINQVCGRE